MRACASLIPLLLALSYRPFLVVAAHTPVFLTAYLMLGLQLAASYLEDPFGHYFSDLPLDLVRSVIGCKGWLVFLRVVLRFIIRSDDARDDGGLVWSRFVSVSFRYGFGFVPALFDVMEYV